MISTTSATCARRCSQPIGPNGPQAVALMLDAGQRSRSLLHDVDLSSHQDTLFVDAGRSLFRSCRISRQRGLRVRRRAGAGSRTASCVSRFRPGKERQGYIAVPSTPQAQAHGLVFSRCRLTREARDSRRQRGARPRLATRARFRGRPLRRSGRARRRGVPVAAGWMRTSPAKAGMRWPIPRATARGSCSSPGRRAVRI